MANLPVKAPGYKYKQERTQKIVEEYFDIFVHRVPINPGAQFPGLQSKSKIILGIDPGTVVMGYSVIVVEGNGLRVLEVDAVRFNPKADAYQKLELIQKLIAKIISLHHPQQLAIEAPFYGKNVQSMLKLGRAQGVAIAAAINAGLEITEYTPRKIKQSITDRKSVV